MVVGEFTEETHLAVIGGGPAGYAAAFRAAELGVHTTLIDPHEQLGGVCLRRGCIPSKTLLSIADIVGQIKGAGQFGISCSKVKTDSGKVRAWVQSVIDRLASGLDARAKSLKIQRIGGEAHFEDGRTLAIVGGSVPRMRFRRAIIATGSKASPHPAIAFDGERVISPPDAVGLKGELPRSLLVIGSGYMAVEIASIFSALGSDVTLAAEEAELLPKADRDLVRPLRRELDRTLTAIRLGETIDRSKADSFDRIVVAVGQEARTEGLNLQATKVARDTNGFIQVDEQMKTSDPRIFAAGDVTGGPLLADVAFAQGRIAAEVAAGGASAFDVRAVPHAIFTDPQIAWCGLTEHEAKAESVRYAVAKIPWGFSGRAVGMGRAEGLTKVIYDPDSLTVLGVGIVGVGACEMIGEGALAVEMGATLEDLSMTLHPHPTTCEMLSDAARSAPPLNRVGRLPTARG